MQQTILSEVYIQVAHKIIMSQELIAKTAEFADDCRKEGLDQLANAAEKAREAVIYFESH